MFELVLIALAASIALIALTIRAEVKARKIEKRMDERTRLLMAQE